MSYVLAYVTVESVADGKRIGRLLVEERLAACVNLIPGMTSIYRWQGRLEEAAETILIAKTRAELFEPLATRIRDLHGYSVPCILELPISRGNPDYLAWLQAETAPV